MSKPIPIRSLSIPLQSVLDGLTVQELEILSNRLKSKNFHPFPTTTTPTTTSLFSCKSQVESMIPKHLLIAESKFNRSMQAQLAYKGRMKIERANRYLPTLPRLPDEIDLKDCIEQNQQPNQPNQKERSLQLRGLRIGGEIEKKLSILFNTESMKIKLGIKYDWRITSIKCNLELTKAFLYFTINGHSKMEGEQREEEMKDCCLSLNQNVKLMRYFISKNVYLKKVPEFEFVYDRGAVVNEEIC